MTINTTDTRKEYAGNGVTTDFAFPFYFLAGADLTVYKGDDLQTIGTHYTVSGAGIPAGGTVTFLTPPAVGDDVVIIRDPDITQLTDYVPNDPFPAETHERALDKLTMIVQTLREKIGRAFSLADSDTSGASTTLPSPEANTFLSWNETATALQNVGIQTVATIVAYGTAVGDIFSGDGVATQFTLTQNPGALNNLDIAIGGVTQYPGLDYTWSSGTTLTFTSPPPAGTNNILVRYMQGLELGTADGANVQFLQAGAGAVQRDAQSKMREIYSVIDFAGTDKTGLTNSSPGFQLAANAVPARDYMTDKPLLKAPSAHIYVPDGNYLLSSKISSNKHIIWHVSSGAVLDETKLCGVVVRDGHNISSFHSGILENATTLTLAANSTLANRGGTYGITTLGQMSSVGPPHSVTLGISNDTTPYAPELTGTTYTANTVSYTNAPDLSNVEIGAIITTMGSPKHMGMIQSIDTVNKIITVDTAWYSFTGTSGTTGVPVNGTDAVVNYIERIWGQNTNVFLRSGSRTDRGVGYELGVLNQNANSPVLDFSVTQRPALWGFDAVNLGLYKSSVGFSARAGSQAPFQTGFASYGNHIGFQVFSRPEHVNTAGFSYEGDIATGVAFRAMYNGLPSFQVQPNGNIEVGRLDAAQTSFIDFHSSGNSIDRDTRIASVGGSGTNEQGTLQYRAVLHDFSGVLRFGTWTANADAAINGYISVQDSTGTARKLATIA